MLTIKHIASGSSGNCYLVDDGQTKLLLEAGVTMKRIREGVDYKLNEIAGCLISHEHGDHSGSVKHLVKAGIVCHMSEGTFSAINRPCYTAQTLLTTNFIRHGEQFRIGTFDIIPLDMAHDSAEPLGFLLRSGFHKLLFATDTQFIRYRFPGLTHIMIECNYVLDKLEENVRNGSVHPAQKSRIMENHFGLENVIAFLMDTDASRIVEVHLLHLSAGNSDENAIRSQIESLMGKTVKVVIA